MKTFHITRPDESIRPALIDKINNHDQTQRFIGHFRRTGTPNRTHTTDIIPPP